MKNLIYLTQISQNSQIYLILIHNLKEWRCDVRNYALAGLEVQSLAILRTSSQSGRPQNILRLIARLEPIPFIECGKILRKSVTPLPLASSAAVHCSALVIAQVDGCTRALSEHTQFSEMLRCVRFEFNLLA